MMKCDPHNDPNVCFTAADPANCDWNRGWFQAAVNMGHLSLQDAQNVSHPDIQVGQTMNQCVAFRRSSTMTRLIPENDPNLFLPCAFEPDCEQLRLESRLANRCQTQRSYHRSPYQRLKNRAPKTMVSGMVIGSLVIRSYVEQRLPTG